MNKGLKKPGPNKGRKFSMEWRIKLSVAKKGIPSWNKGIPMSLEAKEKLSNSNKERNAIPPSQKGKVPWNKGIKLPNQSGEKHPQWKGGITPIIRKIRNSFEYKLWRIAVFERDDYTCIWCKKKRGTLNADHIKPFAYFPELRFVIDNGRTLCVDCHKTTATYGGKIKNYER